MTSRSEEIVAEVERRMGGVFAPADRAAWIEVLDEIVVRVLEVENRVLRDMLDARGVQPAAISGAVAAEVAGDAGAVRHGMLPGSHERRDGPECRCGAVWLVAEDRCASGHKDAPA